MSTQPETRRSRPRGSFLVVIALVVVWAAWGLWFALAPDSNPNGQCEGLGFGCTLTPRDLASFAGAIFGVPMTFVVMAVTLTVRAARIGKGSPRTVWDVLLAAVLLAALVLFVIANVSGSI